MSLKDLVVYFMSFTVTLETDFGGGAVGVIIKF